VNATSLVQTFVFRTNSLWRIRKRLHAHPLENETTPPPADLIFEGVEMTAHDTGAHIHFISGVTALAGMPGGAAGRWPVSPAHPRDVCR